MPNSEENSFDELASRLAEEWNRDYHPVYVSSDDGEINKEVQISTAKEDASLFITQQIKKLVDSGYRKTHSGEEILEVVEDFKLKLFNETIEDISKSIIADTIKRLGDLDEMNALKHLDFYFWVVSMEFPEIAKEAFPALLGDDRWKGAVFYDLSMEKTFDEYFLANGEKSGLDTFSGLFFGNFEREGEIRENLIIPPTDKIMKITI